MNKIINRKIPKRQFVDEINNEGEDDPNGKQNQKKKFYCGCEQFIKINKIKTWTP